MAQSTSNEPFKNSSGKNLASKPANELWLVISAMTLPLLIVVRYPQQFTLRHFKDANNY